MDSDSKRSLPKTYNSIDWELKERFSEDSLKNLFEEIKNESSLNSLLERASIQ